jgi:hypothetical protein
MVAVVVVRCYFKVPLTYCHLGLSVLFLRVFAISAAVKNLAYAFLSPYVQIKRHCPAVKLVTNSCYLNSIFKLGFSYQPCNEYSHCYHALVFAEAVSRRDD